MNNTCPPALKIPGPRLASDVLLALFFKFLLWILHRCGIPTIVCLCGSTRFLGAFQDANLRETLAGKIVLSIGCDTKSDHDLFGASGEQREVLKRSLDWLHKRKIDLADEIYVLNVGGYIGSSTASEIVHARRRWKGVQWLESPQSSSPMKGGITDVPGSKCVHA